MNPSSPACSSNSDNSEKGGRVDSCPPEERLYPEDVVTLLDYLLPLLRWRWLIFLTCIMFGGLGGMRAVMTPSSYVATAYFMPKGAFGERDELAALGRSSRIFL